MCTKLLHLQTELLTVKVKVHWLMLERLSAGSLLHGSASFFTCCYWTMCSSIMQREDPWQRSVTDVQAAASTALPAVESAAIVWSLTVVLRDKLLTSHTPKSGVRVSVGGSTSEHQSNSWTCCMDKLCKVTSLTCRTMKRDAVFSNNAASAKHVHVGSF